MKRDIKKTSYIGLPLDSSAMYLSKKVEGLIVNLYKVKNCLVFIEENVEIPEDLKQIHEFVLCKNPQLEYAKFVSQIALDLENKNKTKKYVLTKEGYYIGENVKIGRNSYIEPLVLIGHDVEIGDNARIYASAIIKNAVIGNNLVANEKAIIGSFGFTMAKDEEGNNIRIPSLGKVMIGNNVEVGMMANVSVGSAGDTIIKDYVKLDAFVHIGHDVMIEKNVEIPAGVIVGGFVRIEENVFIGINSTLRNRITIGKNSIIGMGSVVTKNVPEGSVFLGNPARKFEK